MKNGGVRSGCDLALRLHLLSGLDVPGDDAPCHVRHRFCGHVRALTYDTARIRIAPARTGRGLFATTSFRPGEPIIRVEGRIVHYEVLWRREGSRFAANCIRFGPDTYLDPGDAVGRFVNHSCAPNAGLQKIRQRLFLFAAKGIRAGAEIVIDYSTTIGDDDIWTMRCRCGSPRCRRVIRNFGSLPLTVKRRYMRRGLVPGYIVRTLDEGVAQDD